MRKTHATLVATTMLGFVAGPGFAQDAQNEQQRDATQLQQRDATTQQRDGERRRSGLAYRVSDIENWNVRNRQGEELGNVDDVVIDVNTGRIRYVAMSVGGVLGIGDDLYAIPWSAFDVVREDDDTYLVLNAQEETFENAPGFDEDNWPNFADTKWTSTNDQFYRDAGVSRDRAERRGARQDRQQGDRTENRQPGGQPAEPATTEPTDN